MTEAPDGDDPRSRGPGPSCDRCGGEPTPVRSGDVTVLECGSCGNVLGLVEGTPDADAGGGGGSGDAAARFDEVTAADGDLGQLVALLRAEAAGDDSATAVSAGRLLLSTEAATLEVRAVDCDLEIAEVDRTDD